jgi:hypothetical protein
MRKKEVRETTAYEVFFIIKDVLKGISENVVLLDNKNNDAGYRVLRG